MSDHPVLARVACAAIGGFATVVCASAAIRDRLARRRVERRNVQRTIDLVTWEGPANG